MRLERFSAFTPFGRAFVLGIMMTVTLLACMPADAPKPAAEATPPPIVQPLDRGNGVFYFPASGDRYLDSLAAFYEEKPFLHCDLQGFTERREGYTANASYTVTTGFILHCHDIAVEAQEVTKE